MARSDSSHPQVCRLLVRPLLLTLLRLCHRLFLFGLRPLRIAGRHPGKFAKLGFNFQRYRWIILEKISCCSTALADPFTFLGIPGPGLIDDFLFHADVD